MSSNSYKFFSQNDFSGGIETRESHIKDNQVLDSRNFWVQGGDMVQRPGTSVRRFRGGAVQAGGPINAASFYRISPASAATKADPIGVTASSAGPNLNSFLFGDAIIVRYNTGSLTAPTELRELTLVSSAVTNAVTKTRVVLQAWTGNGDGERGWVNCWCQLNSNSSAALQPCAIASQRVSFAGPEDLKSDTLDLGAIYGTETGYWFRLILVSATNTTGAPFTAGIVLDNITLTWVVDVPPSALNPTTTCKFPGAYFLKYAGGNRFLNYFLTPERTGLSPAYTNAPRLEAFTSDSIQRTTLLDPGASTEPARYDYRYKAPTQPPSVAVIPEFNTAFVAYCNLVLEQKYAGPWSQTDVYPSGSASGPLVAQVNTDPLIVGPISTSNPASIYPSDEVPQLTAFPAANLIVYFSNQLWAAGIQGQPTTIRWSGEAGQGAYNVWPEDSQVQLSTAQDNSEITAIAPLADNLVVFKKNSIWQMIDNGVSDIGLNLYEPRLVVAGVGTTSPQSVRAVNGGLIFLGEDGFYFYDGTPNIKRISDPVKPYIDDINPARTPFAQAVVWRTKQYYLCAVSSRSEDQFNDLVFAYGLQNNDWQIWTGWDVQCWLQVDGVGLEEELWFTDSGGRAYQLGRWTQTDNGAAIDSWFLTNRYGFDDAMTKTALELRVRGTNNNPEVTYNVIGDDVEINTPGSAVVDPVTYPITMPLDGEQRWDDPTDLPEDGVSTWVPTRRRERKSPTRVTAFWFQVKIRKLLKVFGWDLAYENEGRR